MIRLDKIPVEVLNTKFLSNTNHFFLSLSQIDTSEADLSDEKVLDHTYSGVEDDTFQASMIALHGSSCSADLDYLHSSTPKVSNRFHYMATSEPKITLFPSLIKCYRKQLPFVPASCTACSHLFFVFCHREPKCHEKCLFFSLLRQ